MQSPTMELVLTLETILTGISLVAAGLASAAAWFSTRQLPAEVKREQKVTRELVTELDERVEQVARQWDSAKLGFAEQLESMESFNDRISRERARVEKAARRQQATPNGLADTGEPPPGHPDRRAYLEGLARAAGIPGV